MDEMDEDDEMIRSLRRLRWVKTMRWVRRLRWLWSGKLGSCIWRILNVIFPLNLVVIRHAEWGRRGGSMRTRSWEGRWRRKKKREVKREKRTRQQFSHNVIHHYFGRHHYFVPLQPQNHLIVAPWRRRQYWVYQITFYESKTNYQLINLLVIFLTDYVLLRFFSYVSSLQLLFHFFIDVID